MNWRDQGRNRPGAKLPGQRWRAASDARVAEILRAARRTKPKPVVLSYTDVLQRLLARGTG